MFDYWTPHRVMHRSVVALPVATYGYGLCFGLMPRADTPTALRAVYCYLLPLFCKAGL